jgi:hypothetical protein
MVLANLGRKHNHISKIPGDKRAGGVRQAVECLLHKWKALSTNPNAMKK